ncbi:hypothetical protein BDN70DRAFT_369129 [Pholiota conissans]|uniref:Uncharacterized protein n=1 Tax=Pholiota conissans TaxID=109636 RepID=A0A9P6CZ66_9AGAR|nr:hypothetical protein BDN70DRAFT_369129 [Pholiota conissans]
MYGCKQYSERMYWTRAVCLFTPPIPLLEHCMETRLVVSDRRARRSLDFQHHRISRPYLFLSDLISSLHRMIFRPFISVNSFARPILNRLTQSQPFRRTSYLIYPTSHKVPAPTCPYTCPFRKRACNIHQLRIGSRCIALPMNLSLAKRSERSRFPAARLL